MAKYTKKVVLNRAALPAVELGMADGFGAVGEAVIANAQGRIHNVTGDLSRSGGYVVLVDGKKVAGNKSKPRGTYSGVVAAIGFGNPTAHLVEFGTVARPSRGHTFKKGTRKGTTVVLRAHARTRAKPFLTPAMNALTRDLTTYLRPKVQARLRAAGVM